MTVSASGAPIKVAFFDLDHTLIPVDSDYEWGAFTTTLGWNNAAEFDRCNQAYYQQYKAGTLDIHDYVRFATAAICRKGATESVAAHADFMNAVIQKCLRPQAFELVRRHQQSGDLVAIVTATNEFVTRPIAAAFGVTELIAINLVRDPISAWFTGEIEGIPSFREGKIVRVEQWLSQRALSLSGVESTFYSDSINDLPLLEKVTHPVTTNPDERLRAIALERGWRILDLF